MKKLSDHVRSTVHEIYQLFVRGEDGKMHLKCEGDYTVIALAIETLDSPYCIDRYIYNQYIPKERRFELDGK